MLELNEIQGNILAGFNTNVEVLIGLTADPTRDREVAEWLAAQAPRVTTVADVRELRRAIKAPLEGEPSSLTWMCLAIGPELLSRIREDLLIRDEAYNTSFEKRARGALGDRTHPASWKVGGPGQRLDVMLIVAANDETVAMARADELVDDAARAGLVCTYRETARRIQDLEHFGFRDGISQPLVRDYHLHGTIGAGYFVFGYEREVGGGGYSPAVDPNNLLRNGSFMVFRRLNQDVAAFRSFCATTAPTLASHFPGIEAAQLAALLVGRWPGGAVASIDVTSDPGRPPDDNGFDFADDLLGWKCPFGAHIRKVNPRAGPKDVASTPRIIRRGIPFGPVFEDDPNAERGLAFISFQTSIKEQLEFLTGVWMNGTTGPGPLSGHDLLVGRSMGHRSLTIRGPSGPVTVSDGGAQWITPTGGGYLFVPSRTTLGRMADPVAPGLAWRVEKRLAQAQDLVHEVLSFGSRKKDVL